MYYIYCTKLQHMAELRQLNKPVSKLTLRGTILEKPKSESYIIIKSADSTLRMNRIAVSVMFFLHGLCFASWASRIPSIQENLRLSSSTLGAVLFALPAGFFVSLPFAG